MPRHTPTCSNCHCYKAATIDAEKYYLDSAVGVDTPEQFLAYGCFNFGITRQATIFGETQVDYCYLIFDDPNTNMGLNQYIQLTSNGNLSANQSHPATVDESPTGQSPQTMTLVQSLSDSDADEANPAFNYLPYWYCVFPWLDSPKLYLQVKLYCDTDDTTNNTRDATGGIMARLAWSSSSTFGVEDATPCVAPQYCRPVSFQGEQNGNGNTTFYNYGFACCIGQACGGKPCQDCYFPPNSLGNNRIQNWYGSLPTAWTVTMPTFTCGTPANCPQCAGMSGTHTLTLTSTAVGNKCGWSWNYDTIRGISLHIYGPGNGLGNGAVQLAANFSGTNGDTVFGNLALDQFNPNGTNTFALQYGEAQNLSSCPTTSGMTATVTPVAPFRFAPDLAPAPTSTNQGSSPAPVRSLAPPKPCNCGSKINVNPKPPKLR